MAQTTPDEVLRRVLRLSSVNGLSVAIFAGLCALGSLVFGDLLGAGVGLLVAIGGITEVRGRNKLRQRDADGMRLLVRAQWMVLGGHLGLCGIPHRQFRCDARPRQPDPGNAADVGRGRSGNGAADHIG